MKLIRESTAQDMKSIREELSALRSVPASQPKGFSSVGSTEAEDILRDLSLMEVDSNALQPIVVPKRAPKCASFDYAQYENENTGIAACLEYHKEQLKKFGVPFGLGAFEMYDLHTQRNLYSIRTSSGQQYNGNVDGCLSPFGLMATSAGRQCRIVYEHKQSAIQKEKRLQAKLSQSPSSRPLQNVTLSGSEKGQAIMALLAAYSYNPYPLLVDLTDGEVRFSMILIAVAITCTLLSIMKCRSITCCRFRVQK